MEVLAHYKRDGAIARGVAAMAVAHNYYYYYRGFLKELRPFWLLPICYQFWTKQACR
jgi:hypothetical protein